MFDREIEVAVLQSPPNAYANEQLLFVFTQRDTEHFDSFMQGSSDQLLVLIS
jgi:hypothetical protein